MKNGDENHLKQMRQVATLYSLFIDLTQDIRSMTANHICTF